MLPPSEARTPRLVTSVMSGAVTWTTSVPARPQTASLATSVTTASPSLPGSSTGSARCTSNRSCAIDQTAWWRCTSATAIRAAVRLAASSSTAGAAAACSVAYWATCSCTADRARTSRCTVCASQAASRCAPVGSAAPVCPAMVRRASALVRRVFCPACWCSSHSVRRFGGLPCSVRVLLGEPFQLAGDGDGAGAEQVHHVLADPADLGAVAVRPRHHGVAESGSAGSPCPGRRPGRRRAAGCAGCGSPGSATCRRPRRRAGPGSRSRRARAAAGRRRGTGGAGTSWRPGRRRRATPPCGRNGARCGCRWRAARASRAASRAESISASSISSARASSAAAWSCSPRSRACRAETR